MLRTKQVGKWVVSEIGALEGVRMNLFAKKAAERLKAIEKETGGVPLGLPETLDGWAQLSACVQPFLTMDEYLHLAARELQPLVDAMYEVNDDGAELEPVADTDEAKKKRHGKTQKSTNAS